MKAEKFLSEKAIKHLKNIELTEQAENLQNVLDNLKEDLAHYLVRLEVGPGCGNMQSLKAFGSSVYTSGARFNTKGVNALYRKIYTSLVNENSFDLSRHIACSLCPVTATSLLVHTGTSFWQTMGQRKLIHKMWASSSWEGKTYKGDLIDFLGKVELPKKYKIGNAVSISHGEDGTFSQKGSGTMLTSRVRSANNLYHMYFSPVEVMHVNAVGIGRMVVDETMVPAFNYESNFDAYVAAQNDAGEKHLIGFPDIGVLSLRKKLKVATLTLSRITSVSNSFRYIIEGRGADGTLLIECYGFPPFYTPAIERK